MGHVGITLDKDNPPSLLLCNYCLCCSGKRYWINATSDRVGYWQRRRQCIQCRNARLYHGYNSHLEYDEYLGAGCYITGCTNRASCIDHDHAICPQKSHSCEKCRRGPCCASCNVSLREGETVETLRKRESR